MSRESEAGDSRKGAGEGEGECILPFRGGIRANVRDGLKWGCLGGTTFDWIVVENSSEV